MLFTLVDCIEHVAQKQNGSNVDRIRSRTVKEEAPGN
jgi:hypothetical protein